VKEYMTRQEVADLCGVHLQTINNWMSAGYLKPYKIVGVVRFKRQEVADWIESQKKEVEDDG